MSKRRFFTLAAACGGLWLVLVFGFGLSLTGLILATGFFLGSGLYSGRLTEAKYEIWRLSTIASDMAELARSATESRDTDDKVLH